MTFLIVLFALLIFLAVFVVFAALSAIAELWKDEKEWKKRIDEDRTE